MILMILCGVLVAAGLAAVVVRGGERFQPPPGRDEDLRRDDGGTLGNDDGALVLDGGTHRKDDGALVLDGGAARNDDGALLRRGSALPSGGGALLSHVARRVMWWATVLLVGGGVAGLCMAGAGGRLIMRLLAVTSPEDDGRLTDNDQTIGEISLEGTGSFVLFGVAIGCGTALLYGLVRRWLPAGRAGGAAFGLLLLLGLGTVLGPLQPDSRDFEVVGPGWLSIAAFSALAIAHGMLVAVATAWLSRRVPLLRTAKDLQWYLPLLLLLVPLGGASVVVAAWIVAAIGVGWALAALRLKLFAGRSAGRRREESGRRGELLQRRVQLGGRIALVVLAAACTPGFVIAMATILAVDGG